MSVKSKVAMTIAALSLGLGTVAVASSPASADTPAGYCGNNGVASGHYYVFDHGYSSAGHQYFQYSTLRFDGSNWQWNGIYSFRCDGAGSPAPSYGGYYYVYDHSYVSGGYTYDQYSVLYWDGSNYQWDGIFSYRQ